MSITTVPIKSGDHVLLTFEQEDYDSRMTSTLERALGIAFPGVEFTFVYGVTGALVLSKGDVHD